MNPTISAGVNNMRVSDTLRYALSESGWTQKQLARIVNAPEKTVSLLIDGKKELTPAMSVKLGVALELRPYDLLADQAMDCLVNFTRANPELGNYIRKRVEQLSKESE